MLLLIDRNEFEKTENWINPNDIERMEVWDCAGKMVADIWMQGNPKEMVAVRGEYYAALMRWIEHEKMKSITHLVFHGESTPIPVS